MAARAYRHWHTTKRVGHVLSIGIADSMVASASPTPCLSRGLIRSATQNDRLGESLPVPGTCLDACLDTCLNAWADTGVLAWRRVLADVGTPQGRGRAVQQGHIVWP